ncbi:MAG TPA: tetratricopeptide repeat protein [Pirellulales bacterium]|nr:tetratricopeptide repeat protein [Pirellulales bacterium]
MSRVDRVDQHGFPIPAGFDDKPDAPPRPKLAGRRGRWVILALLAAVIVSLVIESPLSTTGRRWAAEWCVSWAVEKYNRGDLPGAIAELDRAIWCQPGVPEWHEVRGHWRLKAKDFAGALADYSQAIELNPKDLRPYVGRSFVYQRMGQPQDAIKDLSQAIKRSSPRDPELLNARAYARAVAAIELKDGLTDIEAAIKLSGKDNFNFIDTRGWLLFRMGDFDGALKDLNRAIELAEKSRQHELDIRVGHHQARRIIEQRAQELDQALAVMYHHRGEIYQKLGKSQQASDDLARGDKLGYNPAEGVF